MLGKKIKFKIPKVLGIVVLGLLLSGNGYAEIDPKIKKIVSNITNNLDFKIKSLPTKDLKVPGIGKFKRSGSNTKDGTYAIITDSNSAFKGDSFYLFTPSFSQCKRMQGHNDCKHTDGTTRTEFTDTKKTTFKKGDEVFIHVAVKPVNNILFGNNNNIKKPTRNIFMQCFGKDGWNIFMMGFYPISKFKDVPSLSINLQQPGLYKESPDSWAYGGGKNDKWKNFTLKEYLPNQNYGSSEWTSVLLHIKHEDNDDGFFKVYIDGELKADHKGPTFNPNLRKSGSCYLKFGHVTTRSKPRIEKYGKDSAELMSIALDAIAFGNSKEEVMSLIENDK